MFHSFGLRVVLMEDLVDDLPLAINLEQSEQVGEPNTGPIVEFEPNSGDRFDEVDADDSRFKLWCRTVLVLPVKEFLDLVRETQAVQKLRKLTLNLDQLMQAGH
jgi:hypothetical protein